jgi:hypothetical protein
MGSTEFRVPPTTWTSSSDPTSLANVFVALRTLGISIDDAARAASESED